MGPIIRLEWQKDSKGYDLVQMQGDPPLRDEAILSGRQPARTIVVPRGGTVVTREVEGQVLWNLVNMPHSAEGVLQFVEMWGLLTEDGEHRLSDFYESSRNLNRALLLAKECNWKALERWVGTKGVGTMRTHFARVPGQATPRLFFRPVNLRSYCWAEIMRVIAGGANIQRCLNCGAVFAKGIEKGTRSTRQYCSDRCRVAMHRKNKSSRAKTR